MSVPKRTGMISKPEASVCICTSVMTHFLAGLHSTSDLYLTFALSSNSTHCLCAAYYIKTFIMCTVSQGISFSGFSALLVYNIPDL